jgi:hypothetical protein
MPAENELMRGGEGPVLFIIELWYDALLTILNYDPRGKLHPLISGLSRLCIFHFFDDMSLLSHLKSNHLQKNVVCPQSA